MKKFFVVSMLAVAWLPLCSGLASGQKPTPPSDLPGARIAAGESEDLTIMTWNLEWFYDDQSGDNYSKLAKEKSAPDRAKWDWKRDAVAESIAKSRPSILAVQEVENRRVLWYLTRALSRNHKAEYREIGLQGRDHFTEQDVGILFRPPVDVLRVIQGGYPKRMRSTNHYYDVTKHVMALLEFEHEGGLEQVLVLNVHLRASAEGEPFRLRQARLLHHWVRESIAAGDNVIVLGDFNTEERGNSTRKESDVGIASGLETADTNDDLIDLNLRLPVGDRQTHLLPSRQFDRILCSPSLVNNDPSKPDLVFRKIEIRRDLNVRGPQDTPEQHWDHYWELAPEQRDVSDHYPVMATFEVR